jgi:hypothetical protein
MASFDFDFRLKPDQQPLVDVCVTAAKRRARQLGCRWHVERLGPDTLRCIIDGQTRQLDLLGRALERDLPCMCEGVQGTRFDAAHRRRTGLGFADLYGRGRDIGSDGVMSLRGVSRTRFHFPYFDDLAAAPLPEELVDRLWITDGVLLDWLSGIVPSAILLEELHTAWELALERLANHRAKRLSFAELIEAAAEQGLLSASREQADPVTLLTQLKDYRKDARHRNDPRFESWLSEHAENVALLLDQMLYIAGRRAGTTR